MSCWEATDETTGNVHGTYPAAFPIWAMMGSADGTAPGVSGSAPAKSTSDTIPQRRRGWRPRAVG